MKKLILTIFASTALFSCSTNSSSDNSNSAGLLPKTITFTDGTYTYVQTFSYNGNKLTGWQGSDGGYGITTYDGDFVIQDQTINVNSAYNYTENYNYANNLLTSYSSISNSSSTNYVFTNNSDGTITENITSTDNTSGYIYHSMHKRYYSDGNCIKIEYYVDENSIMTLTSTTYYTYDTKNNFRKNGAGWIYLVGTLWSKNNETGSITKNASGVVTGTSQSIYQYNSQDFPISCNYSNVYYSIDPITGISSPGGTETYTEAYTYY